MNYYLNDQKEIITIENGTEDCFLRDLDEVLTEKLGLTECYHIDDNMQMTQEILKEWAQDQDGVTGIYTGYYETAISYISGADLKRSGMTEDEAQDVCNEAVQLLMEYGTDVYSVTKYDLDTLETLEMSGEIISDSDQECLDRYGEKAVLLDGVHSLEEAKERVKEMIEDFKERMEAKFWTGIGQAAT